jgi:hypothetical protein
MEAKCQRLDRWEGKEKNERYMLLREERRRKGGGREGKGEREEKRERSKRSGEERRKRRREGESAVFRTSRQKELVSQLLQKARRKRAYREETRFSQSQDDANGQETSVTADGASADRDDAEGYDEASEVLRRSESLHQKLQERRDEHENGRRTQKRQLLTLEKGSAAT